VRVQSGEIQDGEQQKYQAAPLLPENEPEGSDLDSDEDMAEAIVAARRTEFAALSDLNDTAPWGGSA